MSVRLVIDRPKEQRACGVITPVSPVVGVFTRNWRSTTHNLTPPKDPYESNQSLKYDYLTPLTPFIHLIFLSTQTRTTYTYHTANWNGRPEGRPDRSPVLHKGSRRHRSSEI